MTLKFHTHKTEFKRSLAIKCDTVDLFPFPFFFFILRADMCRNSSKSLESYKNIIDPVKQSTRYWGTEFHWRF